MAQIGRHQFKLLGGHPALDFVNTVQDWTVSQTHDYLGEFADAIRFGEAAGLLTQADGLCLRGTSHLELTRLRELRALLQRTFQMQLSGQAPSQVDLLKLSANLAETGHATRLIAAPRSHRSRQVPIRREITVERAGNALLRLRIAESAGLVLA